MEGVQIAKSAEETAFRSLRLGPLFIVSAEY